ncbi:MAG: ABC transporter permease subunit [Tepidibacter sp.]|jgi:putative spermidine/putrescine transport system permease protein|uniref:ABC transporter permease n=1 Tax=Tepidibacter sp. TaxID=2529387 RepID=UPI0025F1C417|nr:ABC transporter permease subunit [Tepidibacter sp.]MCT4508049.1 ABC transporter permease subunit [Tepidibacter sp.]
MSQKIRPYLLVFPAIMLTIILFICGLIQGIIQSLGASSIYNIGDATLSYYKEIFKSTEFWMSFFITIKIAVISTIISALAGTFIVYLLYIIKTGVFYKFASRLKLLIQIPMLFSYLVYSYIMLLIFNRSGWISSIFLKLGIINSIDEFPIIVNDEFGIGIILTYVLKTTPFIVLMLYPVILKVESNWLELTYMLGGNRNELFKKVILKMLINPLKISCFIIFSYTFAEFEIPFLLGVTYPKMISVYSYQIYMNSDLTQRPKAFAINVVAVLVITGMGYIFNRLSMQKWRNIK